jgi:hypothetical protein
MNKEYIERGALLNDIEEIRPVNWTDTEAEITEQADFDWFENLVKSQPTADVQEVRHGKWILSVHSFYKDTYSEESELSVYITASCSECGEKHPNENISGQIFSQTIYAPEGKEYGYKFDEIYERQKVLDKFKSIDYNFKKYCPNCGAKMDKE